ncbi:filamentous hemagglutinin [Rhodoferax ferrireducens]|uniref:Filamentous hemagglutinin n=1 Tax=Rhodoferax ferrireducens TaxID=192843 RepID=A0ABU2CAR9_9BURK|nr:hemagglutinin repeat-containing protein [Rhodoferax ferrireducens]MDR7378434.1 filamentous hemagglutinin [Rhodoferax ferrireducens]
MNQQLYRIVFNQARGCLMAVAETATAQGKSGERRSAGAGRNGIALPGLQTLTLALASVLLLASIVPAVQAQIVADHSAPTNQRPTILTTGNNIPLVNIQTPSAAGVSRNTYSQFDVTAAGAVLNNSRTNVQTQIGGWVQANPWLATGGARVILNEVNSANPSQLRGAIEVAGQRAEVVIANPAGIQVDGAGFINTSRATLTTGTPIMNNGNLDGYRVQTGTIRITGAGLDASSTDSTAILARAVEVNAGIWANQLTVTTGANDISADAATTTAVAGTGTTPNFALDVAAIGGMYAGKITLVGTEAGLGVRNAGVIQANAGNLTLNADGWLSNTGSLLANQNLTAQTSGAVTNSGTVYASGSTGLAAGGNIGNTGLIAALGDTSVTSSGAITSASGGVLAAGLAADNTVGSSGKLAITSTGNTTLAGQSVAGADVHITASSINVAGGQLSGQNLSLTANTGDVTATGATLVASQTLAARTTQTLRTDGAVLSADQLNLAAHDLSNVGGRLLQTGTDDLALSLAGNLDNTGGTIATNGNLALAAATLDNTRGSITSDQSANLSATTRLDNTDGTMAAGQHLGLSGGNLVNTRGTVQATQGNATLVATDFSNSAGSVVAGGNLQTQVATLSNSGSLYAGGSQTLAASGAVTNSGVIAALGETTLTAQSLSSTATSLLAAGLKSDGSLASTGNLNATTSQGLAAYGQNIAAGSASLRGTTLDLAGSQTSATSLALSATAGTLNATGAKLLAAQTLGASSTQTLVTNGATVSAQQIQLGAQALSNVGGNIVQTGSGDFHLNLAGSFNNSGGVLQTAGRATIAAQSLDNANGSISGTDVSIITAGVLHNTGTGLIAATQDLTLATTGAGANLVNQGNLQAGRHLGATSSAGLANTGTIYAGGNTSLTAAGALSNSSVIAAQGNTSVAAASLASTSTSLLAAGLKADGTLGSSGDLAVTTTDTLAAQGQNVAGGNAVLNGASVDLSGSSLTSAANLSLTASSGSVSTASATVTTAGTLAISASAHDSQTLNNTLGTLSAGQLSLQVANLNNTQGYIYQTGSGNTTLALAPSTGVLNNTHGTIAVNSQNLSLSAATLTNTQGSIAHAGTGMLAIAATSFNGQYGQTSSNGALNLTAGNIQHGHASMLAQQITLNAASLDNRAGQIIQLGNGNTSLSTTGAIDNSSAGLIASNGNTTLQAHSLNNQGGTVQAASTANLAISTTAGLDNSTQGFIGAGGNLALSTATLNNALGQITAGGTWTATASGAVTNTSGLLAAMGDLTLNASSLDNSVGTIASVANNLAITTTGGTVNNGGSIQAALDVTLNNAGLSNAGAGSRITGRNLSINTHAQSLNNALGTLAATNNLTVQSGTLNNSTGLIQTTGSTGTLSINTQGQTLTNTSAASYVTGAGGISAQGAMALATGALNNTAGYIGAGSAMTASTGQVNNTGGGQIVGQSGVSFTSTGFDNRSGQVQALGNVSINAGSGSINNTGSLLRSAGTLTLAANTVTNSNTQGSNQGIEGYNVAITASTIANDTGAIRADNNATLTSSGSINNSQGLVSAGNTLTVQDLGGTKTLAVTNTGGRQIAMQALSLNAASLTGNGKMLSQGNLSIALTSDYNNTDEVTANGNASISTTGNITNSGTLQAGNTLSLNASNIDNTATGKISATTTQVTASNTLTNRGLIDGTNTQINAGTLNNIGIDGRIYGDQLSIRAGTVNNLAENGAAGTIAARSRLDIGATTVNNSNGAQIFSLGDIAIGGGLDANRFATGAASTINNSAATIQALGTLQINTAVLNNLNVGFDYRLVTGATSASQTDYITTDGTVYTAADFAWVSRGLAYEPNSRICEGGLVNCRTVVSANGGELTTSPYANPLYEAFYSGPDAYVAAHTVTTRVGHDQTTTVIPAAYAYDETSSIWATFGVAAPTTGVPVYPDNGDCDNCLAVSAEQIAAYEAAGQPWKDLQAKIDAFRAVAKTYILSFKTYRDYTETSQSAEVTAGTAGQILSGSSLSINASQALLNDNSKIIAGGALNITGVAVDNHATQVTTTNTRNGATHNWGVTGQDCDIFGCSDEYGWINAGYTQNTASTLTLGTGITQYNTASGSTATVGSRSQAATTQAAQGTGTLQVQLASLSNTAIGTQLSTLALATGNTADTVIDNTGVIALQRPTLSTVATPASPSTPSPSLPRLIQVTTGTGATVHSVRPSSTLPTASLFRTTPGVTAHYLVETDPAFTQYRTWLSSDALLTALSYDPATVQKRLGDGFYEQQLIREQVAELTGHRFLSNYSSDEQQYQALIASGATYAKAWNLVPGIALSAAQMAQLTTDMVWLVEQSVTLADGSTQKVLVPQLYAVVRDGDLGNTGALLSGGSVNINLTGNLTNTGTIAGRSVVSVAADNIHNLGGRIAGTDVAVQAATNLNNIGGQISANNSLLATAGRDINLTTTTQSTQTATSSYTGVDRVAGLYVTGANGTLVAAAGRDMNLLGAAIGSAGTVTLQAGNNLNLLAVTQAESVNTARDANNYTRFSQSQSVGTTVQASSAVTLSAGQDLTAVAATLNSTTGATTLAAGNNVNILAGRSTTSLTTASFAEGSGAFSSGSTRMQDSGSANNALGSSVGGSTVTVVAGKDITVSGSNVVSDTGTTLVAQNNISIASDKNTSTSTSFFETKRSGFSLDGGINYGNKQQSTDSRGNGDTAAGSTVASLTGDVTMVAGTQYSQVGSAVQTPAGNIAIQAQDVAITEARESSASSTVTKQSSSGFTLAVTSPLISAMQSMEQMADAGSQTSDKRMKALAAVNVGLTGYNAVQSVAQSGGTPGVNVTLSYGKSSSTSTTTNQSNTAAGSSVAAGGNVSIVATGGGLSTGTGETPLQGNILVQGSTISAGDTTTLKADNDILLQAAQSTSSEHSTSKSSSASVGVSFGTGGFNVTASASKSKGQGDGADLLYTNTAVSGGKAVNLQSGRDTLLAGATIAANAIRAQVGRDLTIQSLQDQSSYHSSSSSVGGSVTIGTAMSASASMSKTKVDSDFLSVGTQSGIRAGDGGFQVDVQGDTTLTGGAISSTQAAVDAGVNSFATGGALTLTDIQNQASYSAQSVSVSVGSSGASGGFGNASDSASSTTEAGISGVAGNTAARTGDKETGIQSIFDKDKVTADVQAQVQITQTFSQQAPLAVANYAASQMQPITDADKYLGLKEKQALAPDSLTAQQQEQLKQMEANGYTVDKATADLNNPQYQANYDTWKEGGTGRVIAHTVMGALGGGVSGALGAAAVASAAPTLNELQTSLQTGLVSAGLPPSVAQGLATVAMQGVALGVGAVASGGSVTGATTALGVDANNRQLHPEEKNRIKQLAKGDAEKEARLTEAACALVHCADGVPTDDPNYAYLKGLQDAGANLTAEKSLLSQQQGQQGRIYGQLFQYTGVDQYIIDPATQNKLGTRAGGVLQAVGGAALIASGTGECATGVACVLGAASMVVGADNLKAGATTAATGNATITAGEQVLQSLGLSPQAAAVTYALVGLSPAAVEAVLANKVGTVAETTVVARPTPKQSEIDVGADLPIGARAQISYKNGREVNYGTAGSVRPDWCIGTVCSVEVKNYNINTNSSGLVSNVAEQSVQRAQNLPQGMTQTVVIDVRGQTVTAQQELTIRQAIVQKSNGAISPSDITFKR